jgi:ATP adenylyltransferase
MERLFTPWRSTYITRHVADTAVSECFLCAASRQPDDPEGRVVFATRHHIVMQNLHPYSSGHLMVAPRIHIGSPQLSEPEAQAELWPLVLGAQRVLTEGYNPHGFNLGINLGAAAGAGVPDHFHFHLVPRWAGDTNFMTVLAEVRLVPEDLDAARERLRALFAQQENLRGATL